MPKSQDIKQKSIQMKSIIISLILLIAALQLLAQEKKEIFFADPTIFVDGGKYYLTGTKGGGGAPGFAILESKDLKNWKTPEGLGSVKHMILSKGDQCFGTQGFWAPQIFKVDQTYYLSYTANEQTVLAESNTLLGPYRQKEVAPIDGSAKNIDSFVFRDDDGKYYLYHVRFSNGNYIWVAEFDLKAGKIKPETLTKCFSQTERWEATPNFESAPIMEGPTVVKMKGKYYLFYSANHFKNIDYSVGYAVSDSPFGPWKKYAGNPILHRSIVGENGSGHGDLFEGVDGQLYYVYHVHFSQQQVGPRRTRIVPLLKEWDAVKGEYKFSVNGKKVIVPILSE
jgi:beta-xylosidase